MELLRVFKAGFASRREPAVMVLLGLLLFMLLALLLGGCERERFGDWRYPGGDRNQTNLVSLPWEPEWRTIPIGRSKLAFAGSHVPVPFFGDVRGGPENEIVLVSARRLQIYSLEADLLVDLRFTNYDRVPGFLTDWDGDRKLDIVLGSQGAPEPALTVRNGQGKLVARQAVTGSKRDYGSFEPVVAAKHQIYVVTTETVPSSPRGIIALTREGRQQWEFYVPAEPLGIDLQYRSDGSQILVVSHMTRHTGRFHKFGTEGVRRKGFDSALHLLRVGTAGNVVSDSRLANNGRTLVGRGNFTPLGESGASPLLLKEDSRAVPGYEGEDRVAFHILDTRNGVIETSREVSAGRFVDYQPVVLPGGQVRNAEQTSKPRLAILLRAGSELELRLFDERLRAFHAVGLSCDSGRFGPTLYRSSSSQLHFMVMTERGLLRVTRTGDTQVLAETRNPHRMIVAAPRSEEGEGAALILVGRYLETYRLH